jgi:diguanylate cyclase (GGDEF)-like protein/PAS domain S-box-containing protein
MAVELQGFASSLTDEASSGEAGVCADSTYRLLVESITDYAIYMLDARGIVTNWNPGAERFKGYTAKEIVGRNFECFYTEEDRRTGLPQRALQTAATEGRFEAVGWRVRKDGSRFWANVVIDRIRDKTGNVIGFAKITRDISERREHEERLFRLAHFDSLTGLPNRQSLQSKLADALHGEPPVTVVTADLDGFKDINDTLGHATGDYVLKAAAGRIARCIGDKGIVGRLGGDEFAIVLPNFADPSRASALCQRLLTEFRAPFVWDGQEVFLGITFGISSSSGRDVPPTAEELLTDADLALYRAKEDGKNGFALFQSSFRQAAIVRRTCERELRLAVEHGELELCYQPQVRMTDRRIVGAEALLRWRHPKRGLLAPGAFLSVLEKSSLAPVVGDWAIRSACSHAAAATRAGARQYRVGVNLFGAQFRRGDLVTSVTQALAEHEVPPDALELELTENIILKHDNEMLRPLQALRELGVGIAFDDFGTGYASLSLLKRFPLTRLKIDQTFVRELNATNGDAAVVRAILYLARNFGLDVIAEGVETEQQENELRMLGCLQAQGYLYGRPMPAGHMLQLIADPLGAVAAAASTA